MKSNTQQLESQPDFPTRFREFQETHWSFDAEDRRANRCPDRRSQELGAGRDAARHGASQPDVAGQPDAGRDGHPIPSASRRHPRA